MLVLLTVGYDDLAIAAGGHDDPQLRASVVLQGDMKTVGIGDHGGSSDVEVRWIQPLEDRCKPLSDGALLGIQLLQYLQCPRRHVQSLPRRSDDTSILFDLPWWMLRALRSPDRERTRRAEQRIASPMGPDRPPSPPVTGGRSPTAGSTAGAVPFDVSTVGPSRPMEHACSEVPRSSSIRCLVTSCVPVGGGVVRCR